MSNLASDGIRMAQLFRRARGIEDERCCALEAILEADHIEVAESSEADPGFTACLMRVPGGAGIMLAPGQDIGRRRFSLAHELAHFHIPKHQRVQTTRCLESDLRTRSHDAKQFEWEANDFAAELLMPARLFRADTRKMDLCFHSIYALASPGMYNVSVTAAAWRVIQTSNEACALVVVERNKVTWVARSRSFPTTFAERGQAVHPGTQAAGVSHGQPAKEYCSSVDWYYWLDGGFSKNCQLLESTHAIPRLGQTLSVLWMPELEPDDDQNY